MSLRTKTVYLTTLIILSMLFFNGLFSRTVALQGFNRLEQQLIYRLLIQGQEKIGDDQRKLMENARDWASWDDTYRFMADHNSGYIESNLPTSTFANLRLNIFILLDQSGQQVVQRYYDTKAHNFLKIPVSISQQLMPGQSLNPVGNKPPRRAGILVLPEGLMMAAAQPILSSNEAGPSRGTLIMGRYLDVDSLKLLSSSQPFSYTLKPLYEFKQQHPEQSIQLAAALDQTMLHTISSHMIEGIRLLPDINGRMNITLSVCMPRTITRQGNNTMKQVMGLLGLYGVLLLPIVIHVLDRTVLRPITNLRKQVAQIGTDHSLATRLSLSGDNEITSLGNSINSMLASLENYKIGEEHYQYLLQMLDSEKQRLRNIIDFLPDATVVIDNDHRVMCWNRTMEDMTGLSKEEMIGQSSERYAELLYGQSRPTLLDLIDAAPSEIAAYYPDYIICGENLYVETYIPGALGGQGAFFWKKAAPLRDDHYNLTGAIETIRDISVRKALEDQLRFLSFHDALTGLYNRTYFNRELSELDKANIKYGVLICDVDGLKLINDSMGHDIGDRMLKGTADVLRRIFGELGSICRIGGDEFAVILTQITEMQIEDRLTYLEQEIALYNQKNPDFNLSISNGYALKNGNGFSADEVIREADQNMYRQKLYRSQSARNTVVRTLMKALEVRDIVTENHAQRLAVVIELVADAMGYPLQHRTDLMLLGQFHDIGKVGITDAILNKPGALNAEEYEEMKRHSEIGYRIAMSAPELTPIARLILTHHERWDGNGYPLGLKGEEIPLECRILAVVDAYDAMTSDRPYRKAMTKQAAVEEIIKNTGTQFDPQVANKFLEVLEYSSPDEEV